MVLVPVAVTLPVAVRREEGLAERFILIVPPFSVKLPLMVGCPVTVKVVPELLEKPPFHLPLKFSVPAFR